MTDAAREAWKRAYAEMLRRDAEVSPSRPYRNFAREAALAAEWAEVLARHMPYDEPCDFPWQAAREAMAAKEREG